MGQSKIGSATSGIPDGSSNGQSSNMTGKQLKVTHNNHEQNHGPKRWLIRYTITLTKDGKAKVSIEHKIQKVWIN